MMKENLLNLIDKIEDINKLFKSAMDDAFPRREVIHDNEKFIEWREEIQFELQTIFDATNDQFIFSTIEILEKRFKGWTDRKSFNELKGKLLIIKKNIDKYYTMECKTKEFSEVINADNEKKTKIFISHSSKDEKYVNYIVELLEDIGLKSENLFCSSIPGYGIPVDNDIYEYLKEQFNLYDLHVIFVLSNNYYESVACLNEMGATWILQNRYTSILLPGFEFKDVKGAINPRKIAIKLDSDSMLLKEQLGELKDNIIDEFNLSGMSSIRWEKKRDQFIENISKI